VEYVRENVLTNILLIYERSEYDEYLLKINDICLRKIPPISNFSVDLAIKWWKKNLISMRLYDCFEKSHITKKKFLESFSTHKIFFVLLFLNIWLKNFTFQKNLEKEIRSNIWTSKDEGQREKKLVIYDWLLSY